jgi:cephalosporin-C deacetylase-like acetyl esterase
MSRKGNSATSLMFRFVQAFVFDSLSRERLRENGPSAGGGSAEAVRVLEEATERLRLPLQPTTSDKRRAVQFCSLS